MIEICPAILQDNSENFKLQLQKLSAFNNIDIDIIRRPFVDSETLGIDEVLGLVNSYTSESNWAFHLMVVNPEIELEKLVWSKIGENSARIYLQQESDLSFLNDFAFPENWLKGISVMIESDLKDLSFYNDYQEVQFMSIKTGFQGGEFKPEVLERVKKLKDMGYTGKVSLDGGINLETAPLIKDKGVDRVSVGSYFAKATDIKSAFEELNNILN